jgi:hypothetical protein
MEDENPKLVPKKKRRYEFATMGEAMHFSQTAQRPEDVGPDGTWMWHIHEEKEDGESVWVWEEL